MARKWVANFSYRVPIRRQHLSQPMHRSTNFLRVYLPLLNRTRG